MTLMKISLKILVLILSISTGLQQKQPQEQYPPEGFVYVHEAIPDVVYAIRYAGNNNFIGNPVPGYERPVALLSSEAATALGHAQEALKSKGYRIQLFDAYRPQSAVNHFIEWARDEKDTLMKEDFYPEVDKKDLFKLGYIAERSGHSRGSTVDLSLVDIHTDEEVDMGSPYDFFGERSHHGSPAVTPEQTSNRNILRKAMEAAGFEALPEEWWHYRLKNEPYPDTYFDFPVR